MRPLHKSNYDAVFLFTQRDVQSELGTMRSISVASNSKEQGVRKS